MSPLFLSAKFKYPWRFYQKRILDEIEKHLDDEHIHVIAPPGSGKTVLGLEILRQIGEPVLILAPTLAIRDQWIERFDDLFLAGELNRDHYSLRITEPKLITSVTYQALHLAMKDRAEEVIVQLRELGVRVLVVDEAHHLTKSWWESLYQLKTALAPKVIGLTATPPYDVSWDEWQRYETMNGEVDAEIAVPELVAAGDLCPHQDYVLLSSPRDTELATFEKHRQKVTQTLTAIRADESLKEMFLQHPFYQQGGGESIALYEQMDFYCVLLIYLNSHGIEITEIHKTFIGDPKLKVPELTDRHVEILINYFLFSDDTFFKNFIELRQNWADDLKKRGLLGTTSVNWSHDHFTEKHLAKSINKINSIQEIVELEYTELADDLRMVILTDYIRKEFLKMEDLQLAGDLKLGAVPVFKKLSQLNLPLNICLLTGTLVIVPRKLLSGEDGFTSVQLATDDDFAVISHPSGSSYLVKWVTKQFQAGELQIIVGTHALLGEGWDAPAINSLVMASYVGAHVTTNQMRGRAMRASVKNPNKTANIWHLATINPVAEDGGAELVSLKRRFNSFIGVTSDGEARIKNGLERISAGYIHQQEFDHASLDSFNAFMKQAAVDRKKMARRWSSAIQSGSHLQELLTLQPPDEVEYKRTKTLVFTRTVAYFLAEALAALGQFAWDQLEELLEVLLEYESPEDFESFFRISLLVFMVTVAPKFIYYFYLSIKYRDVGKDLRKMGETVLQSMWDAGHLKNPIENLSLIVESDEDGSRSITLSGSTFSEASQFLSSLEEMLQPIANPRYLVVRESLWFKLIHQEDFHSLPKIFDKNKTQASLFFNNWLKRFGRGKLLFTRFPEGRKALLHARFQALSGRFVDSVKREDVWR